MRMLRGRGYRAFRIPKKAASFKEAKRIRADGFNLPSLPLAAFLKYHIYVGYCLRYDGQSSYRYWRDYSRRSRDSLPR